MTRVFSMLFFFITFSLWAEPLTFEKIYSGVDLQGKVLKGLSVSPNGEFISYLKASLEDKDRMDLWVYDVKKMTNHPLVESKQLIIEGRELTTEEKQLKERSRNFSTGITSYFWGKDSNTLLFPIDGKVYIYTLSNSTTKQLDMGKDGEIFDPEFSNTGRYVSYVINGNSYIYDIVSKEDSKITFDGTDDIRNGEAEFVAQEEMDRFNGKWWSTNDSYLLWERFDQSVVNQEERFEISAQKVTVISQRYPRTGTKNVAYQLYLYSTKNKKVEKINIDTDESYLARVKWIDDEKVSFQILSRDQQTLTLYQYDVKTKQLTILLTEKSKSWVELHNDLYFLKDGRFIWSSWRDGYKHFYLYSKNGSSQQLTKGEWMAIQLKAVDEKKGIIYFMANKETPLEQHLYKVNYNHPNEMAKISEEPGVHDVTFSLNAEVYVDNFSNIDTPPKVLLHDNNGKILTVLENNALDKNHPYFPFYDHHSRPQFGTIYSSSKEEQKSEKLIYRVYYPVPFDANKKYPVIVHVYGGPQVQEVSNRWDQKYWSQVFAQNGFFVISVDNRGSSNRGEAFQSVIKDQLGKYEVEDQIELVNSFKEKEFIDADRIGVFGWSYGGYMSLMSIFNHSDLFRAGVAVAPVTDWTLYDTCYTERYLSTPEKNRDGYNKSSPLESISKFDTNRCSLLLVHGMADDNVLFSNSTLLIEALQNNNKSYQEIFYPGCKHSIQQPQKRIHLFNEILKFFKNKLKSNQH